MKPVLPFRKDFIEWMDENLKPGSRIALDGRTLSIGRILNGLIIIIKKFLKSWALIFPIVKRTGSGIKLQEYLSRIKLLSESYL
jgi:hypothetical protein